MVQSQDISKGIYLESALTPFGLKGSNISEKLNSAYYIENGEIQYAVKDCLMAGTVETFLNNLTTSSVVIEEFGRKMPHIKVDGFAISGGWNFTWS